MVDTFSLSPKLRGGPPESGPSASTGGYAVDVRSVEGAASVSTGGYAVSARGAEGGNICQHGRQL